VDRQFYVLYRLSVLHVTRISDSLCQFLPFILHWSDYGVVLNMRYTPIFTNIGNILIKGGYECNSLFINKNHLLIGPIQRFHQYRENSGNYKVIMNFNDSPLYMIFGNILLVSEYCQT